MLPRAAVQHDDLLLPRPHGRSDFDRCLLCVTNYHLLAFELPQPRWQRGVPCFRLTLRAEKTARWPHQQTHNSINAPCEAACSPVFPLVRLCPSCPHSDGFRTARVISLGSSARIESYQEQEGRRVTGICTALQRKSSSDEELIRGPTVQTQVTKDSPSHVRMEAKDHALQCFTLMHFKVCNNHLP